MRRQPATFTDGSGNLVRCTVVEDRLVVVATTPQKRMAWPNLAPGHARRLARILIRFADDTANEPRPRPQKGNR